MGCWNHTCAVSNLHITAGQDVTVFLLLKNHSIDNSSFCYGSALYDVVPLPFYGKYDDYGGVEECHGFGLPIIINELKQKLYRFGQGPNSVHDCEVTAENLTIEKLFEADGESRLGIQDPPRWNGDEHNKRELEKLHADDRLTESQQFELDRLVAKIKKQDSFRQVTHVVIHGEIFRTIMEKWYIEDYVGAGEGTTGYGNNYNRLYFKDLEESIHVYIDRMREASDERKRLIAEIEAAADAKSPGFNRLYRVLRENIFEWNDPCIAGRWMNYFSSSSEGNAWGLIKVSEHVSGYVEAEDWAGLGNFVRECLVAAWVNSFMNSTRKIWVKQCGQGSQNSDPLGYQVLAQATLDILAAEKAEYGYDEDEEAGATAEIKE